MTVGVSTVPGKTYHCYVRSVESYTRSFTWTADCGSMLLRKCFLGGGAQPLWLDMATSGVKGGEHNNIRSFRLQDTSFQVFDGLDFLFFLPRFFLLLTPTIHIYQTANGIYSKQYGNYEFRILNASKIIGTPVEIAVMLCNTGPTATKKKKQNRHLALVQKKEMQPRTTDTHKLTTVTKSTRDARYGIQTYFL